jgi:putative PIG3 family NAD(P)H quinone oxidoreductase
MKAIEIKEPGGPEALVLGEIPTPKPGAGEALIRVRAAGVNRPDVFQRMGFYPPPPGAPDTPGLEVAGDVVEVGSGVTDFKVGDALCALVAGGGYAEYCVVQTPVALPAPKPLSMVEAAAIPETFFTVWTNVFDRGRLIQGESILIHGGSSGIGTTAIMLAREFGAKIFATAGTDEKCTAMAELGAHFPINYKTQDFAEIVQKETADQGLDLVLDMVGGDYIPKNIQILGQDGRLVFIAFLGGAKAEVDFMQVMAKRLTITGSTLRARAVAEKGAIAASLKEHVWPLIAEGSVKQVIDSTFALRDAAKAHALMESSSHVGKIVLTID